MADLRALVGALGFKDAQTLVRQHRVHDPWRDERADREVGTSKLTVALIERKLGTRVTGRNWNTVLKIRALLS